jgi:hypothetical protein
VCEASLGYIVRPYLKIFFREEIKKEGMMEGRQEGRKEGGREEGRERRRDGEKEGGMDVGIKKAETANCSEILSGLFFWKNLTYKHII